MNELTRAGRWIYQRLDADTALATIVADRIYADIAPPGIAWPFVIFQHQGSADVAGVTEATRIMVSSLWTVKAVAQTESWEALRTAADRIDAVLHNQGSVVDDGIVLACVREQPISFLEADQNETPGVQWRHLGGMFRLLIQI